VGIFIYIQNVPDFILVTSPPYERRYIHASCKFS